MASTFDSDPPTAEPALSDEPEIELVVRVLLGELTPEQACDEAQIDDAELTEWIRRHRRAARRWLDERVAATLAARGVEKDDFVIAGNLETIALSDLLETVHLGRKNAHIRIEQGGHYGHLWCSDGDVIDAQVGELSGTPAVYALLELREGRLQAEFTSEARERTVVLPTDVLLLEAARRADEERALHELIDEGEHVRPEPALVEWHPPADAASSPQRPSEISVPPVAPSLASMTRWLPEPVQRYGVVPLAAGALALTFVLAFGAGTWRGLRRADMSERALATQAPALARLSAALCGSTMVLIPAGAGTPADLPEGAPDAVQRPFCLARALVSSAAYQVCVDRQRCTPARVDDGKSHDERSARCNAGQPGSEQLPINCVTQQQAHEYCEWRGQRLPSPAEWELAWRWQHDATSGERTSDVATIAELGLGESSEWTRSAEQELYAVLGGKTQRDWSAKQPRRMYTSVSTDGLSLGFRCASDLSPGGATREPAAARAP